MIDNIATINKAVSPEPACKTWKRAWIIWDTFYYVLMVTCSITLLTGGYWVGRFYPFNTRAWALEFVIFLFVLPISLLLVMAHSILLIIWKRKYSFLIHLLTIILLMYFWQPGYKTFTYGFREHFIDGNVISQIHNWLKDLDPELCDGNSYMFSNETHRQANVAFPEAILALQPEWLTLNTDSKGHPKVKLEWGMGPDFIYGIEIGGETMVIPKTRERVDHLTPGEFRLPVNSYSYVLCWIN